jgi:outer membrane protein
MNAAQALTLADAIAQALHNDPSYLAAQANLNANLARSSQAFAKIMPQLNASADTHSNRRSYTLLSSPVNATPETYSNRAAQLNLTQTLFHAEKYLALSQSERLARQAEFQLLTAEKEMLIRLAQVWLEIRQSSDAIAANNSKVQASQKELDWAKNAWTQGVLSVTEFETATAHYEQSKVELLAAQNEQLFKLATLEQIIGSNLSDSELPANTLQSSSAAPLQLEQNTLAGWLSQADTGNPALFAALEAQDAADQEIRKQRAGHLPTLELVASYNNVAQGSGLIGGQSGFRNIVSSIGLQLNMPLFSGGEQNAKIAEAIALRDKASYELEASRRNVHLRIKQSWLGWQASQARQHAGKLAVKFADLALKSAQAQRTHGVQTDLDVLKAQQQCDEARRDMNKASNDAILNLLKLKADTGQLVASDLLMIESDY